MLGTHLLIEVSLWVMDVLSTLFIAFWNSRLWTGSSEIEHLTGIPW